MAKKIFTGFTADMNINFTGIDNVSIAYTKVKPSVYTKADVYSFYGDMFDDMSGQDKTDFKNALKKAGSYYELNCTKDVIPDTFLIHVMKEEGDRLKIPPRINFYLNFCRIPMNTDATLPIFSYIGKILVKIQKMTDNENIIKLARTANKMLTDEIIKYLG